MATEQISIKYVEYIINVSNNLKSENYIKKSLLLTMSAKTSFNVLL